MDEKIEAARSAETQSFRVVFVDLDGTLLASDTLLEGFLIAVRTRPIALLKLALALLGSRAVFKCRSADFRMGACLFALFVLFPSHCQAFCRVITLAWGW
jgi:hypothetical protein